MSINMEEDVSKAIALNIKSNAVKERIDIQKLSLTSAVDKNIPRNSKVNNRYALIIGNEDYASYQSDLDTSQNVPFAAQDAESIKNYLN